MAINNTFSFIGTCYGDARKINIRGNEQRKVYDSKVILAVKSLRNESGLNIPIHIPIYAVKSLAETFYMICKNNNQVAVKGEVVTREKFDKRTGSVVADIFFLASEVTLLAKSTRNVVGEFTYKEIVQTSSITTFKPLRKDDENETSDTTNDNGRAEHSDFGNELEDTELQ